jgi:hypothetical protein
MNEYSKNMVIELVKNELNSLIRIRDCWRKVDPQFRIGGSMSGENVMTKKIKHLRSALKELKAG